MTFASFGASVSADPFKDFFAHQDQLTYLDSNPEPAVEVKPQVKQETRQGDPHRMKKVGEQLVDDHASNYSLPNLDDISWMRVELFHNEPGSGQTEWVLKFIINQCAGPEYVNTSLSTREVYFNLFSSYAFKRALGNCKENPTFLNRFKNVFERAKDRLKDIKACRPRGQKTIDAPIDQVIAGFCYVKKAPWGTVTFPQQQAVLMPWSMPGRKHEAVLSLRQNDQRFRTIIMHDMRGHIPEGKTQRDENAAVMVGYLDQVGYMEWLTANQQK
jgi:hypothetical protein